ncbi:MAG TPA: response regulator transcription factor [Thermoanaerobaculia bacterium]|nr:response regulator transcription factor [Thermoanaerobaculia bacterium]
MQAHGWGGIDESNPSARVLLSGDQPLMRNALGLLISCGGLTVAEECVNRPDALRHRASGADVVVMDLDLDPGRLTRMELLLDAAKVRPVLIVTHHDHPAAIAAAMRKGAAGVVLKSRSADTFLRAIRVVLAGGTWLERSTVASVFHPASAHDAALVPTRLTRREMEVVQLVTEGLQNKKIAERLSITDTTVRHHLTSIFEKLSVTNRMELMRYAYDDQRASHIVR